MKRVDPRVQAERALGHLLAFLEKTGPSCDHSHLLNRMTEARRTLRPEQAKLINAAGKYVLGVLIKQPKLNVVDKEDP